MGSFLNDPAQEEIVVPEAPPVVVPTVGGSFLDAKVDDESLQQASIAPVGGSFLTVDPSNPLPVGSGEGPQVIQESLSDVAKPSYFSFDPVNNQWYPDERGFYFQDSEGNYQHAIREGRDKDFLSIFKDSWKKSWANIEAAQARGKAAYGLDAPELPELEEKARRMSQPQLPENFAQNIAAATGNLVPTTLASMKSGATALGRVISDPTPMGLVKYAQKQLSDPEGLFEFSTLANAGDEYKQMLEQGVDEKIARRTAQAIGPLMGVLDVAEVATYLEGGKVALTPTKELAKKEIRKLLFDTAKNVTLTAGAEGTLESGQEAIGITGEEVAKKINNYLSGAEEGDEGFLEPSTLDEDTSRVVSTFVQTVLGSMLPGAVGPTLAATKGVAGQLLEKIAKTKEEAPTTSPVQEEMESRRSQVDDFFVAVQQAAPHIPTEQLEAEKQIFYRVMDNLPEGTDTSRFLDVNNLKASVSNQEVGDAAEGVLEQNAIKALGMDNISDMSIPGTLSEHLLTAMGSKSVPKDLASMTIGEFMEFAPKVEAVAYLGAPERKAEAREVLNRLNLWDEKSESLKDNWDAPIVLNLRNKLLEMPDVQAALGEDVVLGEDGKPVLVFHGTGQGGTDNIFTIDGLKKLQEGAAAEDVALLNKVLDPVVAEGKTIASVVTKLPLAEQERIHELAEAAKEKTGFERFEPSSKGVFFASSPSTGGAFSTTRVGPRRIAPVFLKGKLFDFRNPEHIAELQKETFVGEAALQSIKKGSWESIQRSNIQDAIKRLGFTGFVERENSSINYSVFSPDQVVPAFDPLRKGKGLFQTSGSNPNSGKADFEELRDLAGKPTRDLLTFVANSEAALGYQKELANILLKSNSDKLSRPVRIKKEGSRSYGGESGPQLGTGNIDVVLEEVLHTLTSDALSSYIKEGKGTGNYLDQVRSVIEHVNTPKPVANLLKVYLETIDKLGYSKYGKAQPSEEKTRLFFTEWAAGDIRISLNDAALNKRLANALEDAGVEAHAEVYRYNPYVQIVGLTTTQLYDLLASGKVKGVQDVTPQGMFNYVRPTFIKSQFGKPDPIRARGIPYHLGNIDEFLVGIFTDKSLQQQMAKVQSDSAGMSIWESFLDALYKFFNYMGIMVAGPNLLEKAIVAGAEATEFLSKQGRTKFDKNTETLSLQQKGEETKGSIQFQNRQAFFNFLSGSDISTVIHEGAHWFFMFLRDEQLSVIAKWAKVDLAILQKAVADPTKLTADEWTHFRTAQEKFANGWEKWRRANRPPISALEEVFQKFKEWLTNIYSSLAGEPRFKNLNITPEVQKLFEDMIVSENERKQEYGEIWNPITQARFQVYKDQRGMHSVLVYKGKNSFWLPVRTLMQGKQPTKLQMEFLGKDAAWLSPQFIATARDLSSLPAKIEETYRQLDHMSKKELRIAAEKYGIEVPASLVEKEDIALHVESALRARMALDSKEHPLLGVEEGGVIRKLHRMGPLAQNLLSTISSIFTANSEEHIRHAGMLEDQTGRDFEQYGRGVIGKSKEIFGHLYSDLTKFLEALKPSLLGGEGARNVFDLQRIQRVGNAGFYKWSRAVEGRIPLSDLNPAQQRIVQLYIKLSSLIGELAEKGSISGVRLAKSGILSYDSKMVTESVDEKTGETKKKRGGYRPFTSAKGTRAPRWPTSTLFLIMSNRDTVKERMFLAEILAAIPENQDELGESPEKRIKRAFKLLGGERGQQSLSKRDSVEVMRSFKVFPDVMWIGSRKYDLMHGDMYQAAVHMTYGAASRLGFIFQSAKFDDKLGVYRNDKDMVTPQISKFKTEAGRKRVEKAILALQGKQAYLGHESMPGSVLSAVRAVHSVMLTAFKGLKLPLSVSYNLWETLGLTHALFGSQRYVTALLNLYSLNARETEGILGRLGSLSLLPSKLSLNPSRPVRSVIDLLAAVPLMPVNAANAFNEKLTAETAKQMVIDLRGRVNPNTGQRVRRVLATDRTVLKMFGFTESEIADMLAGTADIELYNEVIRRSVPNTQGTSASIAERPLIPSSRYYRDFIQFTTYFNKEARSHARLIGLAVRGDKQAYKILAKDVGGKLVGGFIAMMMVGLFKGGLEDWREKKKKAETASGIWDLINEMFVSQVMGGPFYTVVRSMFKSPQARVEGEFNLNWLAPISPITSWYADIARAIRGMGTYGGLTMPERMTKLASRSSVLTPGVKNVLYMTGLGAEDYNRDRAYAAYWKWYRKAPGNKQTTLYTQEEQEHKEFRFFTKRAYLKAKELGPLDPEVTSLLLQGAMQGMTLEQFAEEPEGAWDSIAASLSARKLLDIDEDTGIGKLGLKGQEYLRSHLTDEQWSILLAHDELINMMLETTKDMK